MIFNSLTKVAAAGAIAASLVMGKAVAEQPGAAASVPAQFQGNWRVSFAECPPAITDRPVWINASRIRLDHSVGETRLIEDISRRNVTIAAELLSDGDPWNAKLRLELSDSESELTISEGDWSVKLQRCPEEKTSK